jgi:sulfate transport system permease protein
MHLLDSILPVSGIASLPTEMAKLLQGWAEEEKRNFYYKNVPVLDSGARGPTTTFVQRGMGDVLIAWENEAFLAAQELGKDKLEIVLHSYSILAEPPVSVVDKVAEKRGTAVVAKAYLEYLYSDEGQEIAALHYYRPRSQAIANKYASQFPKLTLFTVDQVLAGGRTHKRPTSLIAGYSTRSTENKNQNERILFSTRNTSIPGRAIRRRGHSRHACRTGTFEITPAKTGHTSGFGISLGFTVMYLSLIVLLRLSAIFFKTAMLHWTQFWETMASPLVVASYRLTFGASFVGASIDAIFGFTIAWVLARYEFPGKRIPDALVDLPFALPTAVAGIALTSLYAPNGWIGRYLHPLGIDVVFTRIGVVVAMTFIGLPFVVRSVQLVVEELGSEVEEAWQAWVRIPGRCSLALSFPQCFQRCLPVSLWPLPARLANMDLSFSYRATCRCARRSLRC